MSTKNAQEARFVDLTCFSDDEDSEPVSLSGEEEPIGVDISVDVVDMADDESDLDSNEAPCRDDGTFSILRPAERSHLKSSNHNDDSSTVVNRIYSTNSNKNKSKLTRKKKHGKTPIREPSFKFNGSCDSCEEKENSEDSSPAAVPTEYRKIRKLKLPETPEAEERKRTRSNYNHQHRANELELCFDKVKPIHLDGEPAVRADNFASLPKDDSKEDQIIVKQEVLARTGCNVGELARRAGRKKFCSVQGKRRGRLSLISDTSYMFRKGSEEVSVSTLNEKIKRSSEPSVHRLSGPELELGTTKEAKRATFMVAKGKRKKIHPADFPCLPRRKQAASASDIRRPVGVDVADIASDGRNDPFDDPTASAERQSKGERCPAKQNPHATKPSCQCGVSAKPAESSSAASVGSNGTEPLSCRNFIVIDSSDDESDKEDKTISPSHVPKASMTEPHSKHHEPPVPIKNGFVKAEKNASKFSMRHKSSSAGLNFEETFREDRDFDYNISRKEASDLQEQLLRESVERMQTRVAGFFGASKPCSETMSIPIIDVHLRFPDHWQWRDPYARLGLPKHAPMSLAKTHYRRLAKIYHPDKSRLRDSAERFHAITAAYRKLTSDP